MAGPTFIGRARPATAASAGIHHDMFGRVALNVFRANAAAAVERYGPAAKTLRRPRQGQLAVGDLAVVIAFGSPHRDEAFRGCRREVIEAVHTRRRSGSREQFRRRPQRMERGCSLCGDAHAQAGDGRATRTRSPRRCAHNRESPAASQTVTTDKNWSLLTTHGSFAQAMPRP